MQKKKKEVKLDYIPVWLPCGRKVNAERREGDIVQCCKNTECHSAGDNYAIDTCYDMYKNRLIGYFGNTYRSSDFTFQKDMYYSVQEEKRAKFKKEFNEEAPVCSEIELRYPYEILEGVVGSEFYARAGVDLFSDTIEQPVEGAVVVDKPVKKSRSKKKDDSIVTTTAVIG